MSAAHASTPADLVLAAYSTGDADARGLITVESCIEVGVATSDIAIAKAAFHLARNAILNDDDDDCKLALSIQKASSQTLRQFQDTLLTHVLRTDVPLPFRLEAVACVTAVAAHTATNGWPKLWLNASTVLNDPNSDPSQCHVFGVFVRQAAPFLAGGPLRANLGTLMSGFEVAIMRSEHEAMVVECVVGLSHLMMSCYADLALLMQSTALATMLTAVMHGTDRIAFAIFDALFRIVDQLPELIPAHLSAIQRTVLYGVRCDRFGKDTKAMICRCVDDLSKLDLKAFKKRVDFITQYVDALLEQMSTPSVEVNDAWMNSYDEDEDASDIPDICAVILDTHTVTLQGAVIGPLLLAYVEKNIHSPQWQKRYAALTVLMVTFEGYRKVCLKRVDSFLKEFIVPRLADEHPVVRFTAIRCFAQLLLDLAPIAEAKLKIAFVLPSINAVAAADPIARLRAVAVSTLDNYFQNLEDDDFPPFAELAFECAKAAAACARSADANYIRQYCLVSLATLPAIAKSHLHELQELLCPIYNAYFELWDTLSPVVQCRTLECSSLMASAVGAAAFGEENAARICETLLKIQRERNLPVSDEMVQYVMRSWSNMADCMRAAVVPFIDQAVPYILTVATTPCPLVEEQILPGADAWNKPRTDGLTVIPELSSPTQLTLINTDLVSVKDIAMAVILYLVKEQRRLLLHHFDAIQAACVELLDFRTLPSVVENAAEALSYIGTVHLEDKNGAALSRFVAAVREPLLRCAHENPAAYEFTAALTALLQASLPEELDGTVLDAVAHVVSQVLRHALMFPGAAQGKSHEDEDDDDGGNDEEDEEDEEDEDAVFGLNQVEAFSDIMRMCSVAMAKSPAFCSGFFERAVLPEVGNLTQSPYHHYCAMRVLEVYVDVAPQNATAHLSSIAETAAYFAREPSDAAVLEIAFRLSGKIAPLILAATGSATADAAVMYGASILGAVTAFWDRETPSHDAALSSVGCAIRVAEAFPTAAEGVSLDKLPSFVVPPPVASGGNTSLVNFVRETLTRWVNNPATSGLRHMSAAARNALATVLNGAGGLP